MLTGSRLGPYEVLAKIGEGGMGEVYRATDTNLGRSVAIKVLPEAVASDPERLARFDREARTLATLNHPNIAQIYGLERTSSGQAGVMALVMELVPGPTLADRIAQGPVPLDEALPIARQIAEALEAAHEHGIIHRDLKPANIKVRDDGTVKVLDFGLAKAIEPTTAEPAGGLSRSPTITTPHMTQVGVILGTPAYMSPEQARGRQIDRRSDIWAFGAILYETLSGRRAFADGESVSDTLAGILRGEPDWTALPAETPRTIRSLMERCLRKDLKRRLPDIAQARIEIEEAPNEPAPAAPVATSAAPVAKPTVFWPAIAGLSLLGAAAIGAWMLLSTAPASQVVQFDIMGPPGAALVVGQPLSPDGRTVAFLAPYEGKTLIWLRPLDSSTAQPLEGTEDASRPFWSPNSQFLAFFAQGKLKKAAIAGGPPSVICNEPGREGAWGPDNVILIGGRLKPIHRVSASGGEPAPVTEFGPNETTHDYPEFLPDGRHFLYMARAGAQPEDWSLFVGSLDSKERTLLPGIHSGARYSPSGHLLFERELTLMAQAFDAGRLQLVGEAFAVDRLFVGPHASMSVSNNGSLAYLKPPLTPESQLTWADRTGGRQSVVGQAGTYGAIALSPDGKQIAFQRHADLAMELFILNLDRGSFSRFTSNPAADFAPIWSPDGGTIAFGSSRDPAGNNGPRNANAGQLYDRAIGSVQDERLLLKTDRGKTPTDWSRDGRYLAFISANDVWALPMPASDKTPPIPVTNTPFVEASARFSPDGRWIAYRSNESGSQTEVWVQSFPETVVKQQVSTNGGSMPRWRADGKELYYAGPDSTLMAVTISAAGDRLQIGTPVPLFSSRAFGTGGEYDVARDGRFLLSVPDADATSYPITVIVNWTATLKQ